MILRVCGSGEVVQHVFWLDLRSRTCGVRLWNPQTGHERCSERSLADFLIEGRDGATTVANVELLLGDRAEQILRDVD